MRFGVNYTPSKNWFYSWLDPDWAAIQSDFAAIAALGLDHVRIFPFWTILQPDRGFINPKALADLRQVVRLAAGAGLDAYVDVLQGHMSSFDHVPAWLVSWHERSMFADPEAVAAQAALVEAVYDCLADESTFKGLTLGNECNQFADRSHPRVMAASPADSRHWLESLAAPVIERAHDAGRVVLHSENDAVWYADGHPFLPQYAANLGDVTAIHSWVFNGTAQYYGGLSEQSLRHAEYLIELSKAFAADPDRPVWLQEIGAPGNVVDPVVAPDFCRQAVLRACDCPNLYGLTWWCSHDVDSRLKDFPPFEHDLGLFDQTGTLKPIGHAFQETVAELRQQATPVRPRTTAVVVPVDQAGTPTMRAACSPGGSIFEEWMRLATQGERPTCVSSAVAAQPELLADRGVRRCVEVDLVAGRAYSAVSDPSLTAAQ